MQRKVARGARVDVKEQAEREEKKGDGAMEEASWQAAMNIFFIKPRGREGPCDTQREIRKTARQRRTQR